jgi:hypothetical protein
MKVIKYSFIVLHDLSGMRADRLDEHLRGFLEIDPNNVLERLERRLNCSVLGENVGEIGQELAHNVVE